MDIVDDAELQEHHGRTGNKTAELSSYTHRPIADYKVTHPPATVCPNHQLLNCVRRTQRALKQIAGAVTSATASKTDLNKCLLAQYERQLHVGEVKAQLSLISRDVASLEPEDENLSKLEDDVYKFYFDLSFKLHRSLHGEDKSSTSKLESSYQDWRSPVSTGTL